MLGSHIDLPELARSAIRPCSPLNPVEARVVRSGQRALLEGVPVSFAHLAGEAAVSIQAVIDTFERLPGLGRFDAQGRVVGLLGLSIEPTPHRLVAGGPLVFTWCAWDSLFIPRITGKEARISSNCPISRRLVQVRIAPDGIVEAPNDTLMSFRTACEAGTESVVQACCADIHFLSPRAAADRWMERHPDGVVLTLDEAWEVGRSFVDDVLFGSAGGGVTTESHLT